MILFGDYHTHTKYSHGKGTVIQNAAVAAAKGLKEIAICDHGFNHISYAIKRNQVDKLKQDIQEAEKTTGVKILCGIEANIISRDGTIDLKESDFEKFNLVLCGFHNFVRAKTLGDQFNFILRNILFKPSKKQIDKNTAVMLRVLEKNKIDVLVHLNYGMKVNILEVARAARDSGTFIELNGKRILFSDEEIIQMANEGVKFIISSDAHSPNMVGENNKALNLLRRLDIPVNLVANLGKLPIFKRGR